jgi:hypothetical protein
VIWPGPLRALGRHYPAFGVTPGSESGRPKRGNRLVSNLVIPQMRFPFADGRVVDDGEIAEVEPRRRLVIRWRHQKQPELRGEGESRCTIEVEALEPGGSAVKLSITHTIDREPSKLIRGGVRGLAERPPI